MAMNREAENQIDEGVVPAGDLGPLAWVLDETRKSIESSTKSLKRYARDAEQARGVDIGGVDASQLRLARQQLHQAVGALEMVGQPVAAQMVRGMEAAVQQFVLHPDKCSEVAADTLERAGFALVEYLESQLSERPRAALGLFPQFKQVQEMAGADRVHPADLWSVDWRWADPLTPPAPQPIVYSPEVRSRLDQRVLKIMKHADINAAAEVSVISLGLADGEHGRQPKIFWKLSAAFFEGLGKALLPMDVYAKRMASRILLQYTSLVRGDQNVSERLAKDLLFFCAQAPVSADARTPLLDAVRRAWSLEAHDRPVAYERLTFGLYDPSVLAQARRRIEAVKENWSALAGGDMARLKACVDQFGLVAESLIKLHEQGKPLADALTQVAKQAAHSSHPPSAELAMETATAVLFLEAAFADFHPADTVLAQRMNQLAERLDAVRGGATAPALESWMEELYRSVSDRQTMGTVIGEVRATLTEAEQHLDQYFRNPGDKSLLADVPNLLAQMKGVLTVLGLDQAALTVSRMRDTVDELIVNEGDPNEVRAAGTFDRLANNAGALGFLVDMLGYQPVLARKLFVFDADAGELRYVSGRSRAIAPEAESTSVDLELDISAEEAAPVAPVLEVASLTDSPVASATLPGQLEQIAAQAALDEKPELARAAARAAEAARDQDEDALTGALEHLQSVAAVSVAPTSAPAVAAPTPDIVVTVESDEDDELLDIFLEEARDVIQTGQAAIEALGDAPGDVEQQTTLRRAYHTLKGSSRMVGLTEFGEAAWSLEQLLNAWLAEKKPASDDLRGLAAEALAGFSRWVDDIAAKQAGAWQSAPFKLAADALRTSGTRLPLDLTSTESVDAAVNAEVVTELAEASDEAPRQEEAASGLEVDLDSGSHAVAVEREAGATPTVSEGDVADQSVVTLDLPDLELIANQVEDATELSKGGADGEQSPVDFLAEVETIEVSESPTERGADPIALLTDVGADPGETERQASGSVQPSEQPAAAGGSPMELLTLELPELDLAALDGSTLDVGLQAEGGGGTPDEGESFSALGAGADGNGELPPTAFDEGSQDEQMLSLDLPEHDFATAVTVEASGADATGECAAAAEAPLDEAEQSVVSAESTQEQSDSDGDHYKQIGDLRISTPLYNVYLNEADEWSRHLITELSEWSLELDRPVPERAIALAHSLAGSSATVGFAALSELARAVEHALERLHGQPRGTPEQARVVGEAAEDMRRVLHQFAAGILKSPSGEVLAQVQALEPTTTEVPSGLAALAPDALDASLAPDESEVRPAPEEPSPLRAPTAPVLTAAPKSDSSADDKHVISISDEIDAVDAIDPDLFPIFAEEAEELLPQLSAALREWVGHPHDRAPRAQVLRALHTLKGSARLAGALRLGEMAHRAESAIETIGTEGIQSSDLEPLLDHLDALQLGFKRLQVGEVGAEGVETSAVSTLLADAVPSFVPAEPVAAAPDSSGAPAVRGEVAQPTPLSLVSARAAAAQAVRVRAQLLDRLVAQAGEIMTSRTRLEAEVGRLRTSLNELTGNLDRLRSQLRDVELQAETQMQSRLALSKDAQQNFDPLEFDRFTRMQELTRMMAESVNDVATVQRSLQRAIEASEDDLAAQARQSRELQRDLLRTRMVEFEGISERLYRVVRQAAKETGKQVRLDIVGGSIEMDRAILDRMTPAFEHLLRNCVVHGIEDQAVRVARSKDPTGVITVEVQQAGNDVSVEFRDDGAGLNLTRIRERAIQQGLITADQSLTDAEIGNLIFASGFTTATEVTELAGRGVGMDVVRTEVQALGGRIETSSRESQGSSFRLVLPLTTAVTHVVLVRTGNLVVGVPSNLIEIVQRASVKDLHAAYASGTYRFGDAELPFFWSGALLQSSPHSVEPTGRTTPVVIFRSAAQRVAVHVDEVLGNQEVVVKALGPQLLRLPGLVAITALASGAVALIYNPVALATVYGDQARAMSVAAAQAEAEAQSAAADAASSAGGGAVAAAAEPHSDIPLVLVVDDSITVRRVTQRLLQREGYRVALAADGLQGLERLQAERPAVVLSDIEMPRMDGFDFVRNIRADESLADLPVIMITSRIAEKHREHARELGVTHYLGKPYAEDELLGLIKQYTRVGLPAG